MTDFTSLFENCGKFYLPGRQPAVGDPLPPIHGGPYDPEPPTGIPPGRLPIVPQVPALGEPLYRCAVETYLCPNPFQNFTERLVKSCVQCTVNNLPGGTPLLSPVIAPAGYEDCIYRSPTCDDSSEPCENEFFLCPGVVPKYKCQETSVPCPPGYLPTIRQIRRDCVPCGPNTTDPDCVYTTPDCSDPGAPPCFDDPPNLCIQKPNDPGGPQGPGPDLGFKCVTQTAYCPPGTTRAGDLYGVVSRNCEECVRGAPTLPSTSIPGTAPFKATITTSQTACVYGRKAECEQNCNAPGPITTPLEVYCNQEPGQSLITSVGPSPLSLPGDPGDPVDPGGIPPGRLPLVPGIDNAPAPFTSVGLPPQDLIQIQERNANVLDVNEQSRREDYNQLKNFQTPQRIFDSQLNFFNIEPDNEIKLVPNNRYLEIFDNEIDVSIQRAFQLGDTDAAWTESDVFNVTPAKIEASLNSDLLTSFKILRYPGGEVVGLGKFLDMIQRHILSNTLDRIDPKFYVLTAQKQLQQQFTLLGKADTPDYASRFSINYIIENGERLTESKDTEFKTFQGNRGRVLNEDINLSFKIDTILSGTKNIAMPNEGIDLSTINEVLSVSPDSVGLTNKVNIGDGGGYYLAVSTTDGDAAIPSDSLLETSYYLPEAKKAKVLSLNGKSFVSKITATSLTDKHEFVSGDAGTSTFEPMYFGLNLASVESSYKDNPLIENYSGTYSRIVDQSQIDRHVNNNAQSIAEYRISFDDPIYRYIQDTSSFTFEQEDFTMFGFKDGYSSMNFNFTKNIPFAIIIVPVAGSKLNPLNGFSNLINYKGSKLTRTVSFKPSINSLIDGMDGRNLKKYNLYNEDKSTRIGLVETPSVQSFGYKFEASAYQDTFFDGEKYTSDVEAVSSPRGISYLMTEVLDFISENTDSKLITWFDVFRRMPYSKFAELLYTSPVEIFDDIKNGLRKDIKLDFVVKGKGSQKSIVLADDSKTVIKVDDRIDSDELPPDIPADDF